MLQRGRKSQAQREMTAFVASRTPLKVAASQPEPPPAPPDLEPPEKAMWEGLNAEFVIHAGGQRILHSALHMHARARHAREEAAKAGFMLESRFGNLVTHPLLKEEQRYFRHYVEGMRLLKLKF
jgi:hypothetical protein